MNIAFYVILVNIISLNLIKNEFDNIKFHFSKNVVKHDQLNDDSSIFFRALKTIVHEKRSKYLFENKPTNP